RALPLGRDQPFRSELPLQPLERREVVAEAEALDRERTQAEVGALLEELRAAEDVDALAVGEVEPEGVELAPRHRDREAGALGRILEGEEDGLPVRVTAQLGDLALDPDGRQAREPIAHAAVEGCDRVDLAVAARDRLDLHAVQDATRAVGSSRGAGGGSRP